MLGPIDLSLGDLEQPLNFTGDTTCSGGEQGTANAADQIAFTASQAATLYLLRFSGSLPPMYNRWFGAWSSNAASGVEAVYEYIGYQSSSGQFYGDCDYDPPGNDPGCSKPGTYAWAQASDDTVHLCDPFFALPAGTGLDQQHQAGALVHEKAHIVSAAVVDMPDFSACVGDGDPVCYGPIEAQALAGNNATSARANADNYAFFAVDVMLNTVLEPALVPLFLD